MNIYLNTLKAKSVNADGYGYDYLDQLYENYKISESQYQELARKAGLGRK
jgi:hypothetical protein